MLLAVTPTAISAALYADRRCYTTERRWIVCGTRNISGTKGGGIKNTHFKPTYVFLFFHGSHADDVTMTKTTTEADGQTAGDVTPTAVRT